MEHTATECTALRSRAVRAGESSSFMKFSSDLISSLSRALPLPGYWKDQALERLKPWIAYSAVPQMCRRRGVTLEIRNARELVQQRIYFHGYFDYWLTRRVESELKPGDLFIDIGANIGWQTLMAGRLGARVIAFEPSPKVFDHLRRNVSVNQFTSVELRSIALSDRQGEALMTFSNPTANNDGTATLESAADDAPDAPRDTVKLSTFDHEIGILNEPVRLIKIDVEGHEISVLKGMQESLRKGLIKSLIIEIEHIKHQLDELVSLLPGFSFYPLPPGSSRLDPSKLHTVYDVFCSRE
jgi:FkbM family methyltransferase